VIKLKPDSKGEMTNYKNFQDQMHQILQTEKDLKERSQLEQNTSKLAESQLDVSLQRMQDLSARLEKYDAKLEELNKVITNGLQVAFSSSETQPSIS
jgi:uncharacterized protein YdeI (YjbR/CyaY-like superfamily)